MIPDHIEYSTRPPTLAERVYLQRITRAGQSSTFDDAEAMVALIMARTNLGYDEVLQLDPQDAVAIMEGIGEGVTRALALLNLGAQL